MGTHRTYTDSTKYKTTRYGEWDHDRKKAKDESRSQNSKSIRPKSNNSIKMSIKFVRLND